MSDDSGLWLLAAGPAGATALAAGDIIVMGNIEAVLKPVDVALIVPIAMEEKLRFAIREGGRTVGAGVVASIVE